MTKDRKSAALGGLFGGHVQYGYMKPPPINVWSTIAEQVACELKQIIEEYCNVIEPTNLKIIS